MVKAQFVTTSVRTFKGMHAKAEEPLRRTDDEWTVDRSVAAGSIDVSDKNVRILLTLSNGLALRSDIFPSLVTHFENCFSIKLADEPKMIRDALATIDSKLFKTYTRPTAETLTKIIRAGITSPDWAPVPEAPPRKVKPYIYEALLVLVLVHTQVTTAAASLTGQILTFLLEHILREMADLLTRATPRYYFAAVGQATMDIEFLTGCLKQWYPQRYKDYVSRYIYEEIDKGVSNQTRVMIRADLDQMDKALKLLREESRNEFLCFRREHRHVPPPPSGGPDAAAASTAASTE